MIRTFVAIELDTNVRALLTQWQGQAKQRLGRAASSARIQWVRPESIHLTLKFLGDIDEAMVPDLEQALGEATRQVPRFSVEVSEMGGFPDLKAPRVLWVGLSDPDGHLMRLATGVEQALVALGCDPERKPFHPHLTLARIKDGSREVGRALAASPVRQPNPQGRLVVHGVALMKSDLKPSGAVYTRLVEALLKPSAE